MLLKNTFDRNDLRRLEKAAKEKDKSYLKQWLISYDDQIRRIYNNVYEDELQDSIR